MHPAIECELIVGSNQRSYPINELEGRLLSDSSHMPADVEKLVSLHVDGSPSLLCRLIL